jgi:hypothetical protein
VLLFGRLLVTGLLLSLACTKKPGTPHSIQPVKKGINSDEARKKFQNFTTVLDRKCNSCHTSGGIASSSNFTKLKSPADWAASPYVQAGKLEESSVYYRLRGVDVQVPGASQDMPDDKPLSGEEMEAIKTFVLDLDSIVAGSESSLPFLADLKRINGMSFPSLLHKLAFLSGTKESEIETSPMFSQILRNRYVLGDYDFSKGIVEQGAWGVSQLETWVKSLGPYCSDRQFQTRYESNPAQLAKTALGHDAEKLVSELELELNPLKLSSVNHFEAACLIILSSLEFRTQSAIEGRGIPGYASLLASTLVERPLQADEQKVLTVEQLQGQVTAWLDSDEFLTSVRQYTEKLLKASGASESVDYSRPANLAVALVKSDRPYHEILTSQSCYDRSGQTVPCDSGAPFQAGVLTTQAFLKVNRGPFNLSRAATMLESFTCKHYPLQDTLEPKLAKESLIPIFAKTFGEGFGNGTNCYSCHAQFGKHAQLFVKFTGEGRYLEGATGIQNSDPAVASGHAENGSYVSHFVSPMAAGQEVSEFFGKKVSNLKEAAETLVQNDSFIECTVSNVLAYYLRLKDTTKLEISDRLLAAIAQEILAANKEPSFQTIVEKTLTYPDVINSIIQQKAGDQP